MTKYVGVREKKIDTTKVLKHIDEKDFLKMPLEEGLGASVEYFKEKYRRRNK